MKAIYSSVIKTITLAFVYVSFFQAALAQNSAGSSQSRSISGFNKVEIAGAYKVILQQGTSEAVKVEGQADDLEATKTEVKGGTLKVYYDEKMHGLNKEVTVYITFKDLSEIDCSGVVNLSAEGALKFSDLNLESSGTSKMDLSITATKLSIDLSGVGSVKLNGSADKVDLDISGTGKLLASELAANEYSVDISGAGSAEIDVKNKLDAEISGAGSVKYKGKPSVTKDISGAGKVVEM